MGISFTKIFFSLNIWPPTKMSTLTAVGNDKGNLCNKCCTARRWIRYPWSSNQAGSFSVSFHCRCFKTFHSVFEKIFSCCKVFQNVRGRNDHHINLFAHFLNVKNSLPTANYHYCQRQECKTAEMIFDNFQNSSFSLSWNCPKISPCLFCVFFYLFY